MLRKPLLTTHDVAALLKIKEATVRRWIRDGDLPAVNLGREWRIATSQLEEFLILRSTGRLPVPGSSTKEDELATDLSWVDRPRPALSGRKGKQPNRKASPRNTPK